MAEDLQRSATVSLCACRLVHLPQFLLAHDFSASVLPRDTFFPPTILEKPIVDCYVQQINCFGTKVKVTDVSLMIDTRPRQLVKGCLHTIHEEGDA